MDNMDDMDDMWTYWCCFNIQSNIVHTVLYSGYSVQYGNAGVSALSLVMRWGLESAICNQLTNLCSIFPIEEERPDSQEM